MPIEYPGGGVVAEHTAVRERVGHLRRHRTWARRGSPGPGAADFVNACLTNDLGRIGPGQAQYTMCCTESGGRRRRPHRLPALRRRRLPHPQRRQHRRGRRAARRRRARGHHGREPARRSTASSRCRDRAPTRCSRSRLPGRPRLHELRRDRLGGAAGHRLPHRLHRRARLRAGAAVGRRRRRCGTPWSRRWRPRAACRAGSAPATRCAPRWATRCTATTSRSTSPRCRPARPGRSAGTSRSSGAATRSSPSGPPSSPALMRGLLVTGRGIPRSHCAVKDADGRGRRRGHLRAPSRRPCKQGIALALLDRSVTLGDEVVVDVRGRRSPPRCRSRRSSRWGCARSERAVDLDLPGRRAAPRCRREGLGRRRSRRSPTPRPGSARCGTTCPPPASTR